MADDVVAVQRTELVAGRFTSKHLLGCFQGSRQRFRARRESSRTEFRSLHPDVAEIKSGPRRTLQVSLHQMPNRVRPPFDGVTNEILHARPRALDGRQMGDMVPLHRIAHAAPTQQQEHDFRKDRMVIDQAVAAVVHAGMDFFDSSSRKLHRPHGGQDLA